MACSLEISLLLMQNCKIHLRHKSVCVIRSKLVCTPLYDRLVNSLSLIDSAHLLQHLRACASVHLINT